MNNIIEVKDLCKDYKLYDKKSDRLKEAFSYRNKCYHKVHHALNNITFSVEQGETVGIIGTNGSGKSTLLKIITGVVGKTAGELSVKGKISALLELGAGFNKNYTGIQNIFLYGTMTGYSHKEMELKIGEIVEFADIGEFINQPVRTYSSGMFARLAFAVAINVEPDILIVDEALSVGDVFFQNKCFRKFEELREKGTTILFVSHDVESVKQMCNRVLWIEQGEEQLFGNAKEVCNAYATSILGKNNKNANIGDLSSAEYEKGKLKLENYPNIVKCGNESILSKDVIIRAFFAEDNCGNITYSIDGGEKCRLVIVFETKKSLNNVIVGFVIQNKKGVIIVNSNSLITGQKTGFSVGENVISRVEFEFQMPYICSDEYVLDCAVAQGISVNSSFMLTWLYGALRLFINNPLGNLGLLDVDAKVYISDRKK